MTSILIMMQIRMGSYAFKMHCDAEGCGTIYPGRSRTRFAGQCLHHAGTQLPQEATTTFGFSTVSLACEAQCCTSSRKSAPSSLHHQVMSLLSFVDTFWTMSTLLASLLDKLSSNSRYSWAHVNGEFGLCHLQGALSRDCKTRVLMLNNRNERVRKSRGVARENT